MGHGASSWEIVGGKDRDPVLHIKNQVVERV